MNLRVQAAADVKAILEDVDGFGWDIVVTTPAGTTATVKGFSADIGLAIDPETGQTVTSRKASASLKVSTLRAAGLGIPQGIADSARKPWLMRFEDTEGNEQTFKVQSTAVDRTIGIVTCTLEAYQP